MAEAETNLSESMQDEIWSIMHIVAEHGAHPEVKQGSEHWGEGEREANQRQPDRKPWTRHGTPHDGWLQTKQVSEKKWHFECEVEVDDGEVPDGTINVDIPPEWDEKNEVCNRVAESLRKLGDTLTEQDRMVDDIVKRIRTMGEKIEQDQLVDDIVKYINTWEKSNAFPMGKMRPRNDIFQSGVMATLYGYIRSRLENFVGKGEDLSKIALVSKVTMEVSHGLRDSSSDSVNLVTSLTTKFITDKYGSFLMKKGGMAKLVLEESQVD